MAASKLSQLFNRGRNKTPKLKSQGSQGVDDDDDDEGYQDPTDNCPTEPPTRISKAPIPSYPPPRPSSPKTARNVRKDDYQDPWDSKGNRTHSTGVNDPPMARAGLDTYQDPFDTRMNSSKEDYADPFDTKLKGQMTNQQHRQDDDDGGEYDEPYEQSLAKQKPSLNDTYEDPWDTRRSIDLTEGLTDRPKGVPPSSANVNIRQTGARKDDYSDPWDKRTPNSMSASLSTSTDEYDDTYSEPYDKGKQTILDDSRRKSEIADDDDIYDMPYEEKVMIGIAQKQPPNQGIPNFRPQQSKPETPQRPAPKPPQPFTGTVSAPKGQAAPKPQSPQEGGGDYDSPWEWKVSKVEQEFEKRFSVGDAMSKPPVAPRKPQNIRNSGAPSHNINPVPKPQRVNPPPTQPAPVLTLQEKEYEVDPTIPLQNQGWFHGHIRRGEAESLLHNQPDCSYLIRNSESSKIDYSLSLRNRGAPMHLKISNKDGRYILGINSRPYDTIPEMIHHYSMHMLNIKGAEHVKLKYPVFQENMYFTVEPGT